MCVGVKSFFPISPYQDSFSEGQWKVAEEAAVTAKLREVWLEFNVKSHPHCWTDSEHVC